MLFKHGFLFYFVSDYNDSQCILDEVALAIRLVSAVFYPVVGGKLHIRSAMCSLDFSTSKFNRLQAAARRASKSREQQWACSLFYILFTVL